MRVTKWEHENRTIRKQGAADTTYSSAIVDGERIFQIQTYGSPTRKVKGEVSQVMQFDKARAVELIEILKKEFLL